MSKYALNFLKKSPIWKTSIEGSDSSQLSTNELQKVLTEYRAHISAEERKPSGKFGVAVGARQDRLPDARELKRSVMYFDEVLLPDPLFKLTERALRSPDFLEFSAGAIQQEISSALQYINDLSPLIQLNRVRLIPSTQLLEAPTHLPLLETDDAFESEVPTQLREWFAQRVRVRKVVTDNDNRYVLQQGPDADTRSINIDFGQLGRQRGQDFMNISEIRDGNIAVLVPATPQDPAALERWIKQSVNKAAADFLREVVGDADLAWSLGSSYITSCEATASLLDHMRATPNQDASSVFTLELPIVENATFQQLADLLDGNSAAFEAFRFELRAAAETLSAIDNEAERKSEAKKIANRLAREQIHEVDRKIREANRKLKWNVPIVVGSLVAGAVGFAAGGGALASAVVASLAGAGATLSTLRDHQSFRALPGYFLWRLRKQLQ